MTEANQPIERKNLDPLSATARVTQIRIRPSVDIPWFENSTEWKSHFNKQYHNAGHRYTTRFETDDKLIKVTQIYWIDEETWIAARDSDPVAVDNRERTNAYCTENGIEQVKLFEVKRGKLWWSGLTMMVDGEWTTVSMLDLLANNSPLINTMLKIYPLLNNNVERT